MEASDYTADLVTPDLEGIPVDDNAEPADASVDHAEEDGLDYEEEA